MVYNLLGNKVWLSLHTVTGCAASEVQRLTDELIREEYTVPLSEVIYSFLIWSFVALAVVLLICRFVLGLEKFKRELRYINMEIRRTRGSERNYWKKKKRRLWLSLVLPHKG